MKAGKKMSGKKIVSYLLTPYLLTLFSARGILDQRGRHMECDY